MTADDIRLMELERAGTPIRVGMIGAGVTARMIALHLCTPTPGIRLVAISNRTISRAIEAFGPVNVEVPTTVDALENYIAAGRPCAVADPMLICGATNVDVVVEVTGTIEFGARIVMAAIRHRKHVVLVNAELDSTLGPILKYHADRAGVVITNTDGDEPGVAMTLLRYVRSIGLRPVAAGNIKGMIDQHRTPATQREFAARYNQDAVKVTSFADGTKLSMETSILANATGFRVGQRGMYGPSCADIGEMVKLLPLDLMLAHGLVDFALGARPHTGAFVLAYEEHPQKRKALQYYKMGEGPVYAFYTPYHLPHIQVSATIARAALHRDPTVTPLGAPVCEVATMAKRDLKPGDTIDGIGGFMTYGVIENAPLFTTQNLLPMGVSEGCTLKRAIPIDQPITYDDVELPTGRFCDQLRQEQAVRCHVSAN